MYDFSKIAPASVGNYLEPGIYKARIKEAKATESKNSKTPGLAVTFENKEGQSVTETFYVTDESINRLQYLHAAWLGKNLEGKFKNVDEVIAYFVKTLSTASVKKTVKILLVGGKIGDNGRVFSNLPYSGFVIEDENATLGEFEQDSKEYKKYVTVQKGSSEVAGKKNGILNGGDEEGEEEIGKNKKVTSTKTAKPETTKNKAKKEEPVEEPEETDDEPEEGGEDLDW